MPLPFWKPGMAMTADRLNDNNRIGAVVFVANRNSNQSISSGSDTVANAISWNEIELDVDGGWDAGDPTRWTAQEAGWYMAQGATGFNAATGGSFREAVWYVNGALASRSRSGLYFATGSVPNTAMAIPGRDFPRLMEAGDYIELIAAQNSGSALNSATGSVRPHISITYVGPE